MFFVSNFLLYIISLLFIVADQTAAYVSLLLAVQFCHKINLTCSTLQTLMNVSITLVKTVVLAWMASTHSRVTASRDTLGVSARRVCRFEETFGFNVEYKF